MLPEEWDKRLVDLNVRALQDADLAWADCVFVSGMIVQKDSARRLDRALQGGGPDGGGRRPALHHGSTRRFPRWTTSC